MADPRRASGFPCDVVVVGGCGRIGLPLAVALAGAGTRTAIYDVSDPAVAAVSAGRMPFAEPGAAVVLERVIAAGQLVASADPRIVGSAEHVVLALPAEDYTWSSGPHAMASALGDCARYLRDGQILIAASSVSPGTMAQLEKLVADQGLDIDVAFCPARQAQGDALAELGAIPQIVSSRSSRGLERAGRLMSTLTSALVPMSPEEAELAKLFASAWRYISFAVANQMYMMATDRGLDFERIRRGLVLDYPRAAALPPAGFAGGPWLVKDMLRLAVATRNFPLGRAAVGVNEGLPEYLVGRLDREYDLPSLTVGILGMAFKGGSDDIRCSLSYRLRQLLADRARGVVCTDPVATADPGLLPLPEVLDRADLLVIGAPHAEYRGLVTRKPVADIWNLLGRGVLA
ncbi:MAG TPA: UDP binding domain-containing protein [Streptosporangiaceae bacterium]|nr:UDP binding domain-containing protein [Streptosporangiaceae bacterium]